MVRQLRASVLKTRRDWGLGPGGWPLAAGRWALAALLFIGAHIEAGAETIDRVLAVVSGQIITLSDVVAARDLGLQPTNAPDPVRGVLTKLMDRELMLAEVERYAPPEPAPGAVDRELAAVRARFPDPGTFEKTLARSGIEEKNLRETLRQDLRIRAYLDQRFSVSDPRRQTLIDEWLAGLRRRGDVTDLYALAGR